MLYIDDLLIFRKGLEGRNKHLEEVLKPSLHNALFASANK